MLIATQRSHTARRLVSEVAKMESGVRSSRVQLRLHSRCSESALVTPSLPPLQMTLALRFDNEDFFDGRKEGLLQSCLDESGSVD